MIKKITCVVLSVILCMSAGTAALASTPEFGRSEEEWAKLRDDTLEFDEIEALIDEYNATVKNNEIELREFKKTYGTSNADVSGKYLELAEELSGGVDLDPESPTYAMSAMTAVMNDSTIQQLEQQADNTLEDYEIYRLTYEKVKKGIVKNAKSDMIAYYNNQLEAKNAQLNAELLEQQLKITKVQAKNGLSTQVDVLQATENLINAQKTLTTASAAVTTSKKKLQLACGWKYADDPLLTALPAPDFARIDMLNPAADLQTAIENNYTVRINQRKLSNAHAQSTKDTLTITIDANKQSIGIALDAAYLNATASRDAYNYAVTANEVQQSMLKQMQKKHELGTASDAELKAQQIQTQLTQIAVGQAKYAALQALIDYDAVVAGLADV
ncbi:MAG: TolC family protein [Lachnospiraceae bacterium]|nr:TolC family protein [Lachnospiraceae bacterium]